ncbi:MAG: hypothetical protein MJH10_20095 [Epibacterium sp.]|nr:hypothetical protein [Epibacterium sp.]NQX75778.1 hypothetical protein [Epibacterium sp.]
MTEKNFATLEVGGYYEDANGDLQRIKDTDDDLYFSQTGAAYYSDGRPYDGIYTDAIIRRVTIKDYEPEPLDIREGCTVLLRRGEHAGPMGRANCETYCWQIYGASWAANGQVWEDRQSQDDIIYVFPDDTTAAQMAEKAEEQRLKYEQEQQREAPSDE